MGHLARSGRFGMWITGCVAAAQITACGGESLAGGTELGTSSGTSTGPQQASGLPPTTAAPTTNPADDTADAATDSGGASTTTATAGGATDDTTAASSTGVDACADPPLLATLVMAADAELVAPMEAIVSMSLPDMTVFGRSYVEEEGTATFSFQTDCDYDVIVHGLVWDRFAGFAPANADSFWASLDAEDPEVLWPYGCGTVEQGDSRWTWQSFTPLEGEACGAAPAVYSLTAGEHALQLRNREGGADADFAGIAAILITNDANLDPASVFDPSPA